MGDVEDTCINVLCLCQVNIMRTLVSGRADPLLHIAAVRLAILNQILDPWLYILLRRTLVTNVRTRLANLAACVFECYRSCCLIHVADEEAESSKTHAIRDTDDECMELLRQEKLIVEECNKLKNIKPQQDVMPDIIRYTKAPSQSTSSAVKTYTQAQSHNISPSSESKCGCKLKIHNASASDVNNDRVHVNVFYAPSSPTLLYEYPSNTINSAV